MEGNFGCMEKWKKKHSEREKRGEENETKNGKTFLKHFRGSDNLLQGVFRL